MSIEVNQPQRVQIATQLLDRWKKVPAAVAADVSCGACLINPEIRPLMPPGQQPKLFGRALPVICEPPDFGAVLVALDFVVPGDVLVICTQTVSNSAMIGEILSGQLRRQRAAGVICDGAVRDVAELSRFTDFSVFTRHISPLGPLSAKAGKVNVPVLFGGRLISPGDLIIGDDDGLVSLNPDDMTSLIEKAEAKLALEAEWQKRFADGESVRSVFGL